MLRQADHEVIDFGDGQLRLEDDYPDVIVPMARAVACGAVTRGVAICGSEVGASIIANKVEGVRACLIHEAFSAHQGVEDDDLNMICLGGLVVGHALAWDLVQIFLRRASAARSGITAGWPRSQSSKPCIELSAMDLSSFAGKPVDPATLIDVPRLVMAYYTETPDPAVPAQRVSFGTSGHRGTSRERSFNEGHILAITQAICRYRQREGITGPLFLGMDTHALSIPALASALEVLAANGVKVMLAERDEYTPTPVISHAILGYNRGRRNGFADGIVVTPSHNPPQDGGFKYNTFTGGPADTVATGWIERMANQLLEARLDGVERITLGRALSSATTHRWDYVSAYIADLDQVIDMAAIRAAKPTLGVDPLGGAGVHYWGRIAERNGVDFTVVNTAVDPTFRFMTADWGGQICMDPSSVYALQPLIMMKDRFDLSFACDNDHDRHGIVTRSAGLLPSNHYLCAAISYLFQNRPRWSPAAAIGKTVVSSHLIDRLANRLGQELFEVPVGFKWFVERLFDGSLGFGGEESAGAAFARRDGTLWTTDKDGITAALLAAEITARTGRDPASDRISAPATPKQKKLLSGLTPQQFTPTELAGEKILSVLTHAPGNGAPIGGLKVVTENSWFAVRPSGTEDIFKIYAESFRGADHVRCVLQEAQALADHVLMEAPASPEITSAWSER